MYKVWGLAMVRYWLDGVFLLEGQQSQPAAITRLEDYAEQRALKIAEGQGEYQ
jgi:hypothetical protein